MYADIKKINGFKEFKTDERCYILEIANDDNDNMSISRARVEPGIITQWHKLNNTDERYIIVSGSGLMEIQGHEPTEVSYGDVVRIPANIPQRISNIGNIDLIFYCVCTPRFQKGCYEPIQKSE